MHSRRSPTRNLEIERRIMTESDALIDLLLNDIECFENLESRSSEDDERLLIATTTSSTFFPYSHSSNQSHQVITKKRKYQWKREPQKDRKIHVHYDRYQRIIFPRILKYDIRRKYAQMYTNVINSYDYELIVSFFRTFALADLVFEIQNQYKNIQLEGTDQVVKYFMLHLQVTPDRVTNIFDVRLKQSLHKVGKTEVAFNFRSSNTFLYEIFPLQFKELLANTPRIHSYAEISTDNSCYSSIKSVLDGCDDFFPSESEKARALFDPINGIFLKSKFERLENPKSFHIEGSITFLVNEENMIESISMENVRKVGLAGYDS